MTLDKTKIKKKASRLSTKEDLLALLNLIKKDEIVRLGLSPDKFYPFKMKDLAFYCNPNHTHGRYRKFKIKKKTGGFRQITAPRSQNFMMLLQAVNEIFKAMYTPSDYAMGFTENRSVVSNATMHIGQNYVFNLDLKDFFPSIEQPRVWKRLQLQPFNFPKEIANVLAGLCSMRVVNEDEDDESLYSYVLPQGAPTSPIITNMICDTLDRRLAGLAKRFGLNYTRYADDITFSSMHNVYGKGGDFIEELERIIKGQGFTINEAKTRLQKLGSRQEVTGIIVSKKLNVTRKYVREIRSLLYIWEKYGYTSAMASFFPVYKAEKGHIKKGNPDLCNVLAGKLMYMKMVKGEEDPVYVRLHTKFMELVEKDSNSEKKNPYGINYIETISVLEFEEKNDTTISLRVNKAGKRYARLKLGGTQFIATISKDVPCDEEVDKEELAISNCRNAKGEQFWLIHLISKTTVYKPKPIDIDELNDDLDSLLNI